MKDWNEAVGSEIAANSGLLIIQGEYFVFARDAIWAYELRERASEIEERLGFRIVDWKSPASVADNLISDQAEEEIRGGAEVAEPRLEQYPGWFLAAVADHLARLVALKEMPYRDYLKTNHWQSMRAAAGAASDGKCALDKRHRGENVHHRTYERRGRERLDDLILLCQPCHSKHHNKPASK